MTDEAQPSDTHDSSGESRVRLRLPKDDAGLGVLALWNLTDVLDQFFDGTNPTDLIDEESHPAYERLVRLNHSRRSSDTSPSDDGRFFVNKGWMGLPENLVGHNSFWVRSLVSQFLAVRTFPHPFTESRARLEAMRWIHGVEFRTAVEARLRAPLVLVIRDVLGEALDNARYHHPAATNGPENPDDASAPRKQVGKQVGMSCEIRGASPAGGQTGSGEVGDSLIYTFWDSGIPIHKVIEKHFGSQRQITGDTEAGTSDEQTGSVSHPSEALFKLFPLHSDWESGTSVQVPLPSSYDYNHEGSESRLPASLRDLMCKVEKQSDNKEVVSFFWLATAIMPGVTTSAGAHGMGLYRMVSTVTRRLRGSVVIQSNGVRMEITLDGDNRTISVRQRAAKIPSDRHRGNLIVVTLPLSPLV